MVLEVRPTWRWEREMLGRPLKKFPSQGLIPPDATMHHLFFLLGRLPLVFVLSGIHKDLCDLPRRLTTYLPQGKITHNVSKFLVKNALRVEMMPCLLLYASTRVLVSQIGCTRQSTVAQEENSKIFTYKYHLGRLILLKHFFLGNSLAVQWLELRASTAGDTGWIPGWGAKILQTDSTTSSIPPPHHCHGAGASLGNITLGQRT